MTNIKNNIIIVTIFFISFPSFTSTLPDYPQIGTVNVTTTNVYKEPSTSSQIIRKLKNNEKIIKLKEQGDFYQIVLADSLSPKVWVKKETIKLKNLEGKFEGQELDVLKKFLFMFFGDSVKFYTQPFFNDEPLTPVQFLNLETLIINGRVFFIVDYPFTNFEEHECCITPLLILEWKDKNLIARNFYEWSNYEGLLNRICYFWRPNAKEIKKKFLIAEIYEHLIKDYEKAIKKYDNLRILFEDDFYSNGVYGEGSYYGSSRIIALRSMAELYDKLNKKEEALACLYKILTEYPNDTIGGWEWLETADFGAAWCILSIDSTLEECEKIKSISNSLWIHEFADLWKLDYLVKKDSFPITDYLQFLDEYSGLLTRDEENGDNYPILEALKKMLYFLNNKRSSDQAILLIYKTCQSIPKDNIPPNYPGEEKMSFLDYFIKNYDQIGELHGSSQYEFGIIKNEKVRLKVKPNLKEETIAIADRNEEVSVIESQGDWSKILRYDGKIGWILSKQIIKISYPKSIEDINN
jgi:hypothetical protein